MKNYKIFLVDDDIFCLAMYKKHLKNLGYEDVTSFENGTECLNHLTEYPDIIFLDYKMDTLNGFEVLKKIKRFDPNINIVMISGQENVQTAVNALKYGSFDYITKGDNEVEKIEDVINRISNLDTVLKEKESSLINKLLSFF